MRTFDKDTLNTCYLTALGVSIVPDFEEGRYEIVETRVKNNGEVYGVPIHSGDSFDLRVAAKAMIELADEIDARSELDEDEFFFEDI
ncbi:hypothetical protein [Corynebacterium pyruviciproducens]|uniref:Uncharacterized protein n=1 Tax=Corynebacterium pyruviciproducens TaxID=598660 RepID=A0AAF1C050_9CORY|nr:hypothetical protein [Corynebacterium pyruviciproducens]WOT03395.1 hypothetical protein CYJ47_06480 [Corynebacterium pyruviciproducens]